MKLLEEIIKGCVHVKSDRQYWFIRTDGGRLFSSFYKQGVIAIGYPELTLDDFYKEGTPEKIKGELHKKVVKTYPEHKVPGLVVSQLLRFVYEIKAGDVVIIPSQSSNSLLFGIVTSDEVTHGEVRIFSGDQGEVVDKEFYKVKQVNWIKEFSKHEYNPKFFQMFISHQAVFRVNDYAPWIDPMLYDFFQKDGEYHLRLNINKRDGIKFRELFSTCMSLLDSSDELLQEIDVKEDTSNIESKINLNSPGDIDLISYAPHILVVIALLVIFVNGGGLKFNFKKSDLSFDLSTKGFLEQINKLLNSRQDRKLKETLREQIQNLNISNPKEISDILNSINKRNQND